MSEQELAVQRAADREPIDELPRRPRRRLLGVGGNPIPLALLGVLLIACGFIAGVLVEKGQSGSASAAAGTGGAGLAARFAALRGGAAGTGASAAGGASGVGAPGSGGPAAGGGFFGRSGGAGGGGAVATGQVAYLAGSTLYLTTTEGNTVKVTTSPAANVTKTVNAGVQDIHPGETVIVTGTAGAHGAISAESIRVGARAGGGLGALFAGSGSGTNSGGRSSGAGGGSSGGATGGSGPALFGNGG